MTDNRLLITKKGMEKGKKKTNPTGQKNPYS